MEVKEMVHKGQNINAQVYKGQVIVIPGGGGGDIDPEAIKEAVDEYLEANPPAQGAPGKDGADGKDGAPGKDGYTPVKGLDYFTPAEVEEIAAQAADMVEVPEVPDALPNPHAITFKGAVNATYDGSEAVEVEIPAGGGSSDWIPLIDVTLEEDVTYVYTDTDVNGNPFSVKDIYYAVKVIKNPDVSTGFIAVGSQKTSVTRVGVTYNISPSSNDQCLYGMITLQGTKLRAVASYVGNNEYNATGKGQYGSLFAGQDIEDTKITNIVVGYTNNSLHMLAGSIIKVWGR